MRDATGLHHNQILSKWIQVEDLIAGICPIGDRIKKRASGQPITNLPYTEAVYNDYAVQKKHTTCLEGTREALLKEIARYITTLGNSQIYVLSGLVGLGKSTIARTVAERVDRLHLLGASFFFSRSEAHRKTAKKFYTTIAFQLCVYDAQFAGAIERVLITDQGKSATTKDPQTQLEVLILDPLRDLAQRRTQPVVIVIDALDECEEEDGQIVLETLGLLIRKIPSFKVLLTTRPQPHLNHLLSSHGIFYLQNIENKVVNGDIRRYLEFKLSPEQVKSDLPTLRAPWSADESDIEILVKVADKVFIIASGAVLFILDKTVRNPASQMEILRNEFAQNRTPFGNLNKFYSVILRAAVPLCSTPEIVERFQRVVGTIVLLQDLLPVSALSCLIGTKAVDIGAVLDHLQPVIVLDANDAPYIYHKSFADYITDPARYQDEGLRIDTGIHHTRLTLRCLQIMNKQLKQNILSLNGFARYLDNHTAWKECGIEGQELDKMFSPWLRYACSFWGLHLGKADNKDRGIAGQLNIFVKDHLLHWIEFLSRIERLDHAAPCLGAASQFLIPISQNNKDLRELLTDVIRLLFKFRDVIEYSALHIYHSALSLAPTQSVLYKQYGKETVHNLCRVQSWPQKWDAVIAVQSHERANRVTFSPDNACFATWSDEYIQTLSATTGLRDKDIADFRATLSDNFCKTAMPYQASIVVLDLKTSRRTITGASLPVLALALSFDGCRLAAGLSDGSVNLWGEDNSNFKLVAEFGRLDQKACLVSFSRRALLAYAAVDGIKLRGGVDGENIADLEFQFATHLHLTFSSNGSTLASLFVEGDGKCTLVVWNSPDWKSIGTVKDVGRELAISADGLLIATAGRGNTLKLWSGGDDLRLIGAPKLDQLDRISCLAFSNCGMLAIGAEDARILLYDVEICSLIAAIPFPKPKITAFSPDCSRLVTGNRDGIVGLWDVPAIKESDQMYKAKAAPLHVLAFSPDCSRLASGLEDGTVMLWDTNDINQPIVTRKGHSAKVTAVAFSPDGAHFASGGADGTVTMWRSSDGALSRALEQPVSGELTALAFPHGSLAVATGGSICLLDPQTLNIVGTLGKHGSTLLAFSNNGHLLASFDMHAMDVTLWDVANRTPSIAYPVPKMIQRMQFLPNDSKLAIQFSDEEVFYLLSPVTTEVTYCDDLDDVLEFHLIPCWFGFPVWLQYEDGRFIIRGRVSVGDHRYFVPLIAVPEDLYSGKVVYGSSMIALQSDDGRLFLFQADTSG